MALMALIAARAMAVGFAEIAAHLALRHELSGEWPLPLAGTISIILGIALMFGSGMGFVTLARLIGLYAIVHGIALIALSQRLRLLAREMAGA